MGEPSLRMVVIGVSTGGVDALRRILGALPPSFPLPVLVVAHIAPESGSGLASLLDELCEITVTEGGDFEPTRPGTVYLAPPNYHMLVERDGILTLSIDPPVCHARPSIDVLFESAAEAFGAGVIGVILTGAGVDGSRGISMIAAKGGVTIVQDPDDAVADLMPRAALEVVTPDHVVPLDRIPPLLVDLALRRKSR